MKCIIFIFGISLSFFPARSQSSSSGLEGSLNANSANYFLANLKNGQGADMFNPDIYAGVEGSPYYSDQWTLARITLEDNRYFDSILVRVNLYENRIHFKGADNRERMVAVPVKEIIFLDHSSPLNKKVLIYGQAANRNTYLEVITHGKKAKLVKGMQVVIREITIHNMPKQRKFEREESSYIICKGKQVPAGKNCNAILDLLGKDGRLESFAATNNIRCNKEPDLIKLVEFYNSYYY